MHWRLFVGQRRRPLLSPSQFGPKLILNAQVLFILRLVCEKQFPPCGLAASVESFAEISQRAYFSQNLQRARDSEQLLTTSYKQRPLCDKKGGQSQRRRLKRTGFESEQDAACSNSVLVVLESIFRELILQQLKLIIAIDNFRVKWPWLSWQVAPALALCLMRQYWRGRAHGHPSCEGHTSTTSR
jgi:hypothetical protein